MGFTLAVSLLTQHPVRHAPGARRAKRGLALVNDQPRRSEAAAANACATVDRGEVALTVVLLAASGLLITRSSI
jgi:hypothetical protein